MGRRIAGALLALGVALTGCSGARVLEPDQELQQLVMEYDWEAMSAEEREGFCQSYRTIDREALEAAFERSEVALDLDLFVKFYDERC